MCLICSPEAAQKNRRPGLLVGRGVEEPARENTTACGALRGAAPRARPRCAAGAPPRSRRDARSRGRHHPKETAIIAVAIEDRERGDTNDANDAGARAPRGEPTRRQQTTQIPRAPPRTHRKPKSRGRALDDDARRVHKTKPRGRALDDDARRDHKTKLRARALDDVARHTTTRVGVWFFP